MAHTLLTPGVLPTRTKTRKGTYFVQTWGCQMNEEDSEQIALGLQGLGLTPALSPREAHVVVLNTCSVRKKPEDKAFSFLGFLREVKQARPDMVVGVAGCMAQLRAEEIRKRNPFVDFVVGTAHVHAIPGLVEQALQERRFQRRLELPERKGAVVTDVPQRHLERQGKLKAFVPIQYGCDKFCTFCIVPTTRGRERSRPTEHILQEVRRLAELGAKEVTLLGQTVNSYGKNLAEGNVPFAKLLRLLAGVPGIERIRYTSPYPRDFRADLVETIRDVPQVMEHCHMPLQAGHDDLLRRMKRLYTVESYAQIVQSLREAVPELGLTTDVIVGFPGETDDEFQATLDAIERFQFDGAYMFKYSPRPGTPAATLPQVDPQVADDRLQKLIQTQTAVTLRRNQACVGRTFEVLVEGPSPKNPGLFQGYSRCFRMLHFPAKPAWTGGLVPVKATASHLWGLSGEPA
ncbi:MAG: tRNA (N6-isopentenyl adenosine(37)-C2)-methylthiotransferase MiaB [Fimbriimonadaceae bacterium]|nr:tRNA (N6-isopentenyl adenosine(37)-C2)-methylthiotransferase MiaB [Fimbriimonadaceae bacterium]QYK57437.1 MAG: tRNA (N6-isopentenyl adenosine(37)-C2)-methylthiotransferase MiaB [Fimbriimonadaceae bacterium]